MPPITHNNHQTNAHNGYMPGTVIATATNFSVAGQPVARVNDQITTHPKPGGGVHAGAKISQGASSFSIGGQAVARIGDPTSCGGKIVQGVGSFSVG